MSELSASDQRYRLTSLSFAYPAVDAVRRSELSPPDLDEAAARDRGVFVLPTCLRLELVWSGGPELAERLLARLYRDPPSPAEGVIRTDSDAFLHLCRVSAGLDSPLVGETEVFAQFRQAVRRFRDGVTAPGDLARMLQTVIGVSRLTRRSFPSVAEGSLAVEAARLVSSSQQVAVLGAGAMAGAVTRHLNGSDVTLFNRSAATVAGRRTRPWDEVADALATLPAVVSTVPGGTPPFEDDSYLSAVRARAEPLLFVDIGMPPVLDRPPRDAPLQYIGVDDVAASVEVVPAHEAEETVAREARSAWQRLATSRRAGSMISELSDRLDHVVEDEVNRFANRIAGSTDLEAVLRQLARTVARRALHQPISHLGSRPLGSEELDLIAEAFGLEDE